MILEVPSSAAQEKTMLSHGQIWSAIDTLASRYKLTTSGLARKAGLDPTTFNKSKRVSPDGRLRWPSTESIAKILDATGAELDEFLSILKNRTNENVGHLIPLIGLGEAGDPGLFDAQGRAVKERWDEFCAPGHEEDHSFALEINGDGLLPHYRQGDIVICSPNEAVRRGDRIVVRMAQGDIVIGQLRRRTAKALDVTDFASPGSERLVHLAEVSAIARIIWVSQ
jgi:phage repressor protein C with HTH and peptisase S24 domain